MSQTLQIRPLLYLLLGDYKDNEHALKRKLMKSVSQLRRVIGAYEQVFHPAHLVQLHRLSQTLDAVEHSPEARLAFELRVHIVAVVIVLVQLL